MRYNPCGRIVDMGRSPYECDCRFFRDSGVVDKVRWYEVQPDAPVLDRVSIIYRREWDNDQFREVPVGELPDQRKPFLAGAVPRGLPGAHVCGTDQDFEEGGSYEPLVAPVVYSASGWPQCCDPPVTVFGGAGASGHVVPTLVVPVVCPELVVDCDEAPGSPLDSICTYDMGFGFDFWAKWTPGTAQAMRLRITQSGAPNEVHWTIFTGSGCGFLSTIASGTFTGAVGTHDFSTLTFPDVWVRFGFDVGTNLGVGLALEFQ